MEQNRPDCRCELDLIPEVMGVEYGPRAVSTPPCETPLPDLSMTWINTDAMFGCEPFTVECTGVEWADPWWKKVLYHLGFRFKSYSLVYTFKRKATDNGT